MHGVLGCHRTQQKGEKGEVSSFYSHVGGSGLPDMKLAEQQNAMVVNMDAYRMQCIQHVH